MLHWHFPRRYFLAGAAFAIGGIFAGGAVVSLLS